MFPARTACSGLLLQTALWSCLRTPDIRTTSPLQIRECYLRYYPFLPYSLQHKYGILCAFLLFPAYPSGSFPSALQSLLPARLMRIRAFHRYLCVPERIYQLRYPSVRSQHEPEYHAFQPLQISSRGSYRYRPLLRGSWKDDLLIHMPYPVRPLFSAGSGWSQPVSEQP